MFGSPNPNSGKVHVSHTIEAMRKCSSVKIGIDSLLSSCGEIC
nr:MAG TPA: hypothetical protein [Caudoviricetes sp.]